MIVIARIVYPLREFGYDKRDGGDATHFEFNTDVAFVLTGCLILPFLT